jgi:diadenosine tetraphosphate (Ap4A) HIT family hydrolase
MTKHYPSLTAKPREKPSFPTKWLWERGYIQGSVLDFGSGYGKDGEFLQGQGFSVTDYDPYYQSQYPQGRFDTILCQYVLNVLPPLEQTEVIVRVSELLKRNGKAYFAVRRDINHHNKGIRIHKEHQQPTYQSPVQLPFKSILKNDYCEIYEYAPYRSLENGVAGCPFCELAENVELLTESTTCFAILDKYPVNKGHTLIIPKVHEADYFSLSMRYQQGMNVVLNRCKKLLESRYQPAALNVGINVGSEAGQTVNHVHMHLIPRYQGDVDDPTGGVRNIIPGKGNYLK